MRFWRLQFLIALILESDILVLKDYGPEIQVRSTVYL